MTTKHYDVRKNLNRSREPVPVREAIEWYKWLGSWTKVLEYVRRNDGSRFTYAGITGAVRRHDRGLA
jgi:hypothetical protein